MHLACATLQTRRDRLAFGEYYVDFSEKKDEYNTLKKQILSENQHNVHEKSRLTDHSVI
jgi:hypothetical protein